jgi:DNA (cytosine-5)-methyltransferase 1
MTKKYNAISLFSGAMGLDLGLEKTGRFNVRACIEIEPKFCETIRLNKKAGRLPRGLKVFERDISDLDPDEVLQSTGLKPGDVDLLVGGPPCQSFSTAGRRGTVQDPRGTLLWQYLKFVAAIKPRFFLMENVRGLLSAALKHRPIAERPEKGGPPLSSDEEPGSVVRLFSEDLQEFSKAPYHMDCFLVNAVNYGAPQLRERALFIGNRFNAVIDFPDPTHGLPSNNGAPTTLPRAKGLPLKLLPWRTLGDALRGIIDPSPVIIDFSPRKKGYLSMVPPGSNWRSLPEEVQLESMGRAWYAKGGRSGWWRRLSYDLPCPTLVTLPNHASTSLCHPSEVRALTAKEYAAVQEFPSDWEFSGSPQEQYTQIGNAVPTRLGLVAGETIAAALDSMRARKWKSYPRKPGAYRIVYIQSHVRTRKWFKEGETFVWQDGKENGSADYGAPKTMRKVGRI